MWGATHWVTQVIAAITNTSDTYGYSGLRHLWLTADMEIRPTPEGLTGTMSHDKYMQASQWDALLTRCCPTALTEDLTRSGMET